MIAIIEGCGNNVASLQFALDRLGLESCLTRDAAVIRKASHVILPGVGHAEYAMQNLQALKLVEVIQSLTQPVLGICLGMQLLYQASEESDVDCLGIIPGKIKRIPGKANYPVPHMGWNQLAFLREGDFPQQAYVYFVHSYAAPVSEYTLATTEYGQAFTAIVEYENFMGMQFHPERSGAVGEQLLMKFLS